MFLTLGWGIKGGWGREPRFSGGALKSRSKRKLEGIGGARRRPPCETPPGPNEG